MDAKSPVSRDGGEANRRRHVLDAAAALMARQGYEGASMRNIARAAGVQPASIYYFFSSKEELLVAAYEEGVNGILASVERAVAAGGGPWRRLERAAAAHLGALLGEGDYVRVVIDAHPRRDGALGARLVALRDRYETVFKELIAALPLAPGADRHVLRLALLGALNATTGWYRPGGDTPEAIAAKVVGFLRPGLDAEAGP